MSRANANSLPFADAATIVRANQKDNYFSSTLNTQLQDTLRIFRGQRFVNTYPEEITTIGKFLYFLVTTVFGARTLGEEYVDIQHVSRLGKRFPKLASRLSFSIYLIVVPYFVSRIARKLKSKTEGSTSWITKVLTSYSSLLDTMMNIHVALFYFEGSFYSISKRIFGLRYVFGHNKDQKKLQATGNYSVLGGIILVQFVLKMLIHLSQLSSHRKSHKASETSIGIEKQTHSSFFKLEQLEKLNKYINEEKKVSVKVNVDLSDPNQLPYIPSSSRNCMLCLSPMINPSAANCGHFFCWVCITDWMREHPECPLCRQTCLEQNLLPLR
ncbi:hypothetical protein METBIDRAFT_30108 [Metschnikowia bicuspidata var. bicuspidata NRRL YB-4993]|uniref:RING-type E3 ubiquitin transferase n=1 Tax=Metschnikowia bicuspidata var. bicuspidata NRRL YB-4993 TaxID=869754 RepID=A0A1A0HHP4_9ASCO|nr:hypothetical protein METBIDRAFT_30108 [Metschnikowia bicuspidata var. bicuspidata NRRL YB-4993]OBA23679.1 hypothetical protein METBIDRAFT_30108 [Metschnikowia bicuspidata var. bicuspidata NRRL YB-4993]